MSSKVIIVDYVRDSFRSWKSWKYACHAFFYVAALLCFLPQMLGYHVLLEPYYPDQLKGLSDSKQLYTALVVSIAVTFLTLVEKAFDTIFSDKFFSKLPSDSELYRQMEYFEFPIMLSVFILLKDLLIVLYILPNERYDLLNGLLLGSDILFTWCFLYNLTRLGNPVWSLSKVFVIGSILTVLNIFLSWYNTSESIRAFITYDQPAIMIVFPVTIFIVFLIFLVFIGQWVYYVWKNINESTDIVTFLKVIQTHIFVFILFSYLLIGWSSVFITEYHVEWTCFGMSLVLTITYTQSICTALVTIISGKVSKFAASMLSNKLISVRKMFMRYISHEMRTPLNTAVLGLNVLINQFNKILKIPVNHICMLTAKDIQTSCGVAVEILNDMLLYDKIESGLLALELDSISPWSFIKSIIQPFYIQAQGMDVTMLLKLKLPIFECFVKIDKHKLGQVIRNLISNSLKFCSKPGVVNIKVDVVSADSYADIVNSEVSGKSVNSDSVKGNINVKVFKKKNTIYAANSDDDVPDMKYYLRVSVQDDGAGISEENQKKLFHGIIQFNPGKLQNGQGTGLGLYISKGIVDSHQGHIFVKSEGEGQGTTFTLLLPVDKSTSKRTADSEESLTGNKTDQIDESKTFILNKSYRFSSDDHNNNIELENNNKSSNNNPEIIQNSLTLTSFDKEHHDIESALRVVNVLIVDDSGLCRTMIKRAIDGMCKPGCRLNCDQAADGKKALSIVKLIMKIEEDDLESENDVPKHRPTETQYSNNSANNLFPPVKRAASIINVTAKTMYDLILMDYQMPNMDGPTTIRRIRDLGYQGKIVGLTGNIVGSEIENMRNSGADDVLLKPVECPAIEKVILEL